MTEITYFKPKPRRYNFAWFALLIPAILYSAGVIIYAHNAFVPGLAGDNGHALGSALMVLGGESGTLAAAAEVFRKQANNEANAWDWGGLVVSLFATLGNLFVVYVSLAPEFTAGWVQWVRINGPLVLLLCSGVDFYAGIMEFGFLNASFDARMEKWIVDKHTWESGERRRIAEREKMSATETTVNEDLHENETSERQNGTSETPVVKPKPISLSEWRSLAQEMTPPKPQNADELNQWLTKHGYETKPASTARRWAKESDV